MAIGDGETDKTPECLLSSECERGYYCPAGSVSARERPCGHAGVYCPPGSAEPRTVLAGYYSTGALTHPEAPPPPTFAAAAPLQESGDASTRYSQTQCEPGFYCYAGVKYSCLKGRYVSQPGSVDEFPGYSACEPCAEGHYCGHSSPSATQFVCGSPDVYCPRGSFLPLPVPPAHRSVGAELTTGSRVEHAPPGYFAVNGVLRPCPAGRYSVLGAATPDCDGKCSPGYWCAAGSGDPQQHICPAGRYGEAGEVDANCKGSCLAGYFCPAGSTKAWEFECGGETVFCPVGSGAPTPVSSSHYSTGQNTTTRTAEEKCGQDDTPPEGTERRVNVCPSTTIP